MKLLKVKKQKQRFKPELEDICPFNDDNILIPVPQKDETKYLSNLLTLRMGHPFEVLEKLNIDLSEIKQEYECPHTGMTFYALTPIYLISNDLSVYIEKKKMTGS